MQNFVLFSEDVEAIADHGITDVFILMKSSEFRNTLKTIL